MAKNFAPTFVIVAALCVSLTWVFAPTIGRKLPAATRASIVAAVRSLTGRKAPVDTAVATAPANAAEEADAPQRQPVPDEIDDLPSRKGIEQADPERATWGVLRRNTIAMGLDGDPMGKVRGGRFFVIERRFTEDGLKLVGNFTPLRLPRRAVLPAVNLYCFTGSPSSLSERQRKCLRMYYELMADAEELKEKLMREASAKSPYYKPAAEALAAFREKAAKAEKNSSHASETNRQATYELAQLRQKVQELNQKHKDWKVQHAAELPDPEQDPDYQMLLRSAKSYAKPIGGMTY